MTYEEAVAYIENIPKFTKKNDLANTRELMRRLKNPENAFSIVHVAGTNGKGSVCAMLHRALLSAGETVGRFTSPHLAELRERIVVNEESCTRESFLWAFLAVQQEVNQMRSEGLPHPAYFEWLFAMGMLLFQEAGVRYAVVETGLGGRLDATNVIGHPALVVITSIGYDHMKYLGTTIEEIAAEKAGIIKAGCPVVFDGAREAAANVIRTRCEALAAPYDEVAPADYRDVKIERGAVVFSCKPLATEEERVTLSLPFPAYYQAENGAVALRSAMQLPTLRARGSEAVGRSFAQTVWPARMEEIAPEVYFDGAHNVDGIAAFVQTVHAIGGAAPVLLFTQMADKDCVSSARELSKIPWKKIILTGLTSGGTHTEDALRTAFLDAGIPAEKLYFLPDAKAAYQAAKKEKEAGSGLFCAGSLYLIGELCVFVK